MGNGIVRVEDRDVAHRVFRALELERTVYYVQRTVAPAGRRNLRVLVVAGEVAGAMERVTDSWRANIARGAKPRAVTLSEDERGLALAAAAVLEVDVAGVDLLVRPDGAVVVLEVNGIPGWQALQSVCEDDLTHGSCAPARRSSRRDAALVQRGGDQCARGPGRLERTQILVVADAAAGVDRDFRQGGCEFGHGVERRAGSAADAGEVDHQQLADLQGSRQRCGGGWLAAGELGVGRDQPSVAQVDAQNDGG